jgi:hypothetical protein
MEKPKPLKTSDGWLVWEGMVLLELENTLGTKQKIYAKVLKIQCDKYDSAEQMCYRST